MKKEIKEKIKKQAHSEPSFNRYEETTTRNNTNCYSHALGLTYPNLELYRIGAICQRKPIEEAYYSIEEIVELLFLDCKELQIEIKESSFDECIFSDKQYKIALFVKVYADNQIHDYHFWRFDNEGWTEKWKGRMMRKVDFQKNYLNSFPWKPVGIYKISK